MYKLVLVALCSLVSSAAMAQDSPVGFKSTEVVPGIYMLEGDGGFAGGNIGLLVGDEHVVLIDDGIAPLASKLVETVTGLAGRPVDFVINTHMHGDHVGGNAAFQGGGATVVAHDNIRARLLEKPGDAGGAAGLPTITFSEEVTFHVNGMTAHVFHVAHAHTDGDGIVHFPDVNVIHTGDIFFNGMFPFIDLDGGGSVPGFLAALRRIIAIAGDDTIIIPGHGPLARVADVRVAVDMLVDAQSLVKRLVDAGKSADEVVAANPLEPYHEKWNWAFITTERMTRTLHRSLLGD